MKLPAGVLCLACGLTFASTGFGDISIDVINPSFEALPSGGLPNPCGGPCIFSNGSIPDWVTSGDSGLLQPGGPGAAANGLYYALTDGPTEAYTNNSQILQTVGVTVQPGVTYTLQVDIGWREGLSLAGVADLWVDGNHYYATGLGNYGGFAVFTAHYTGVAADAGDPITIQLYANSAEGNFDNVRLFDNADVATPEPRFLGVLAIGMAGLLFAARRRKPNANARAWAEVVSPTPHFLNKVR
jgi:hypothetical protein